MPAIRRRVVPRINSDHVDRRVRILHEHLDPQDPSKAQVISSSDSPSTGSTSLDQLPCLLSDPRRQLARCRPVRAERGPYKFALAKTLIEIAHRSDDRVPLEELAAPFARHLCEHLRLVDKQTTSRSSKFLDACRAFNRDELPEDALVATTTRLGFSNVIDAFHVVGSGPVPVRFFVDE